MGLRQIRRINFILHLISVNEKGSCIEHGEISKDCYGREELSIYIVNPGGDGELSKREHSQLVLATGCEKVDDAQA
ncbi:hypothetical protein SAMN06297251_103126 [Fulvimarina manganoxydans]|uniref:Uncharacterized protein n=1 Tax=Fulvimarina manganoxydans TaxID=937218 RepID=A0A1W1ZTQ9_9HYPH|nr:hypothetical protein SAMN06297251_103126 [Fulvimarina manganoxydans]